jgi:hypothetical protein|tara:strand:+ start:130 stop:426 length:297 start_codon:yes stop_codon:yes gene_type:complete
METAGVGEPALEVSYMSRLQWIVNKIWNDAKSNWPLIVKMIGVLIAMITLLKVLIYFGKDGLFMPIVLIVVPVYMVYKWYSMDYDREQKKIVDKLKDE